MKKPNRYINLETSYKPLQPQGMARLKKLLLWLAPVVRLLGLLIIILACLMLLPALLSFLTGQPAEAQTFLSCSLVSLSIGLAMFALASLAKFNLSGRQVFLLTSLSWLVLSFFAALPFMFASAQLNFTDAMFESISGLTTTGASLLVNLEAQSTAILLWRALLQWLGGIGIIVLGMAILPFLQVGGMRLFQSESSDWSAKAVPRSATLAKAIGLVYLGLTCLCIVSYWLAGMQGFDALVHGLTTSATGGFSNYSASMGQFISQPQILWVGIVFMLLGSLPFVLFVQALQGRPLKILNDSQVQALVKLLLVASLLVFGYLVSQGENLSTALHLAVFNVVSVVSTSGFAAGDYSSWGSFALMFFFLLMFAGGCSGSTSGGFKIFRYQLTWLLVRNQFLTLVHPRAVRMQKYNSSPINEGLITSLIAFAFCFFALIAFLALALSFMGLDFLTSLSAAVTSVTNVGPGLGAEIGPAGNFAFLPNAAKWLLGLGMLLGRLEILTLVVIFTPTFWRN